MPFMQLHKNINAKYTVNELKLIKGTIIQIYVTQSILDWDVAL